MADGGAATPRLTVLRVKRKRGDVPQDTIIVEEHVPASKRAATAAGASSLPGGATTAAPQVAADSFAEGRAPLSTAPPPPPRRQRFKRVDTVPFTQAQSEALLQGLLSRASRAAVTPQRLPAAAPAQQRGCSEAATATRAAQAVVARYTQLRRRRGLGAAPPAAGDTRMPGSASVVANGDDGDPLQTLCKVYDLELYPSDARLSADLAARKAARAARTREAARVKALASQEQLMLCNYVPMLQEVLLAQGITLADADLVSGRGGGDAGRAPPRDADEEDYVFDVYTVDDCEEGDGHGQHGTAADAAAGDMATGDQGPVLAVYDPDDEAAWEEDADCRLASFSGDAMHTMGALRGALEAAAESDSDPDGAEVDYPDEEEDGAAGGEGEDEEGSEGGSLSSDGSDVWGHRQGRPRHVWEPRRTGAGDGDDEEYDTVAFEEHEREECFQRWAAMNKTRA